MNNGKLFVDERKQMIVELLNKEMKKSVAELSDYFSISPATIRSDLRELEKEGLLKRTHGGAISNKKMIYEPTTHEKEIVNVDKKQSIAEIAQAYIQDNDVIVLDTGSTTYELAKFIGAFSNLTVITHDFLIAEYLDEHSNATVIFLGGQLRRKFRCTIGPITINAIKDLSADKVFLGANGITIGKGVFTPNLDLAMLKKEMINIGGEIILLCDSTKIGKASFAKFAEIDTFDVIITDDGISEDDRTSISKTGVKLEVAEFNAESI